jgi:hypothetical protein
MQRLSAWAWWLAVSVFSLFVIPLAVEFLKHMAENVGFYDRPRETAGTVLNFFLDLSERTWLRVTALSLGCFVAGLSVDRLVRRLDGSRANKRKDLGDEMLHLGNELPSLREPVRARRSEIRSCFTNARKFRIWTPDDGIFSIYPDRATEDLLAEYLKDVGTLLKDGHFSRAKQFAKSRKADFDRVLASA